VRQRIAREHALEIPGDLLQRAARRGNGAAERAETVTQRFAAAMRNGDARAAQAAGVFGSFVAEWIEARRHDQGGRQRREVGSQQRPGARIVPFGVAAQIVGETPAHVFACQRCCIAEVPVRCAVRAGDQPGVHEQLEAGQ